MRCKAIKIIALSLLVITMTSGQVHKKVYIEEQKTDIKAERIVKQNVKPIKQNIKVAEELSEEEKYQAFLDEWSNELGFKVDSVKPMTFKATAYSSLPEENGGYTVTCNGKPLEGNIVANNTLPQGTKLYLNGNIYTVADRGSSRFNNPNRIDVLIEKWSNESDSEYKKRVENYGVKNIEGFIIK